MKLNIQGEGGDDMFGLIAAATTSTMIEWFTGGVVFGFSAYEAAKNSGK